MAWQRWLVYAAFLLCSVVALWVPFYNRAEPSIGGVPFFYWFQIAWILAGAVATAVAFRLGL
jgi:Protein of unknown function (DUF3311)